MATEPAMHNERTTLNSSASPGALAITGNAGGTARYDSGNSHPCRSMLVITAAADIFINIGAAAASSAIFAIPANVPVPLPFDDTSLLYVQSSGGNVLYVLPRN